MVGPLMVFMSVRLVGIDIYVVHVQRFTAGCRMKNTYGKLLKISGYIEFIRKFEMQRTKGEVPTINTQGQKNYYACLHPQG